MIDSYINPDEYMYISSDQFIVINEGNHQYSYSIIIQKQNHQDFSINNSTMICSKNANGFYLNSYALKSNEAQNKTEIIGKVISYIPSNHLTNSACVWWQKTNQIVQMLHELIKR